MGVLLRDDLTWHSHPSPFSQNGCPVKSALKKTPVQDFNYFSLMFLCIISTTYQNIGDLFCPVIFLDFLPWYVQKPFYSTSSFYAHQMLFSSFSFFCTLYVFIFMYIVFIFFFFHDVMSCCQLNFKSIFAVSWHFWW